MILKIKYGEVKIKLFSEIAPNHVKRFKELADTKRYDGVVFHRVIDGFMAQTGDVKFGNSTNNEYDLKLGAFYNEIEEVADGKPEEETE